MSNLKETINRERFKKHFFENAEDKEIIDFIKGILEE